MPDTPLTFTNTPPVPYVRSSQTSLAAALSMTGKVQAQEALVLKALYVMVVGTDEEIYERIVKDWGPQKESSIRRARIQLTHRGDVLSTGTKTRNKSGRFAEVWKLA